MFIPAVILRLAFRFAFRFVFLRGAIFTRFRFLLVSRLYAVVVPIPIAHDVVLIRTLCSGCSAKAAVRRAVLLFWFLLRWVKVRLDTEPALGAGGFHLKKQEVG